MSDVQQQDKGGGKKGGKVRSKKASTHIDMTPMVDLAFLLLTFFLLTTTFNKPKTMEIIIPEKPNESIKQTEVNDKNVITLILSKNNRIFYYFGDNQSKVEVTNFSAKGIRKVILDKLAEVKTRPPNRPVVIIKADDDAKYRNFVDILDEMNVTQVSKVGLYAIVDIEPKELDMIKDLKTNTN